MKSEIVWRADGHGIVQGACVHDSRIVEFAYSRGGELSAVMQRVSGEFVELALSGVFSLSVLELVESAIISEVYVWQVAAVAGSFWDVPDSAWNVLYAKRYHQADAKKMALRIAHDKPTAFLVQIVCSYGGAIAALCEKVTFFEFNESVI